MQSHQPLPSLTKKEIILLSLSNNSTGFNWSNIADYTTQFLYEIGIQIINQNAELLQTYHDSFPDTLSPSTNNRGKRSTDHIEFIMKVALDHADEEMIAQITEIFILYNIKADSMGSKTYNVRLPLLNVMTLSDMLLLLSVYWQAHQQRFENIASPSIDLATLNERLFFIRSSYSPFANFGMIMQQPLDILPIQKQFFDDEWAKEVWKNLLAVHKLLLSSERKDIKKEKEKEETEEERNKEKQVKEVGSSASIDVSIIKEVQNIGIVFLYNADSKQQGLVTSFVANGNLAKVNNLQYRYNRVRNSQTEMITMTDIQAGKNLKLHFANIWKNSYYYELEINNESDASFSIVSTKAILILIDFDNHDHSNLFNHMLAERDRYAPNIPIIVVGFKSSEQLYNTFLHEKISSASTCYYIEVDVNNKKQIQSALQDIYEIVSPDPIIPLQKEMLNHILKSLSRVKLKSSFTNNWFSFSFLTEPKSDPIEAFKAKLHSAIQENDVVEFKKLFTECDDLLNRIASEGQYDNIKNVFDNINCFKKILQQSVLNLILVFKRIFDNFSENEEAKQQLREIEEDIIKSKVISINNLNHTKNDILKTFGDKILQHFPLLRGELNEVKNSLLGSKNMDKALSCMLERVRQPHVESQETPKKRL